MAIKRYVPRYKILSKLRQPLYLEKRKKINQFTRQKWESKKRLYFPRKARNFDQDSSTYPTGPNFDSDRAVRLKKTYKYMLLDKQAFQVYYGSKRLKFYQLKCIGTLAKNLARKNRISPSRVLVHQMENRLEVCLYRIGAVSTLGQARKLLSTNRVNVGLNSVRAGYRLKKNETIVLEDFKAVEILSRYLKFNAPFFYFQNREIRKQKFFVRKDILRTPIFKSYERVFCRFLVNSLTHLNCYVDEKNKLSVRRPKTFLKTTNINMFLARFLVLSGSSSRNLERLLPYGTIKLKSCIYRLLKSIKISKMEQEKYFSALWFWMFQLNGFYTSAVENERKGLIRQLRKTVKDLKLGDCPTRISSLKLLIDVTTPLRKRKKFSSLSKGLRKFESLYDSCSESIVNRQAFFRSLKTKRFFSQIFFSRLFLHAAESKKKYRSLFFYFFKRKRKIYSLLHLHTLSSLKFKDARKLRKKFYRKMAWKIKKYKKWRRRINVPQSLFRLRQRQSQIFYVPRHFEINLKTFSTNYLGYTDLKTVNVRIPFWLNLRKLLTFIT